MKVFNLTKNNIEEVEQERFKLEKDIQSLVEGNVNTLFNLSFVSSELSVGNYRIDTLCYDEENNSFVIIEYKKGNSYSVIDQGYTYLQLLLNNKSDFLLVLSQHFNKVLKLEDVDWSQSKIIFVSPSFNSYQKDSVNFKDLPFELWEIKRYSNNTLILNQHRSSSKESIENISSTKESVVQKVSQEVKVYSIEQHTSNLSKKMKEKWDMIMEELLELEGVELSPKRHYLGIIVDGKTISYTKFRKNHIYFEFLRGSLNLDKSESKNYFTIDDPKGVVSERSRELNTGRIQVSYWVNVEETSDIGYLFFLLKQKYNDLRG
jgi:hypothetical protein